MASSLLIISLSSLRTSSVDGMTGCTGGGHGVGIGLLGGGGKGGPDADFLFKVVPPIQFTKKWREPLIMPYLQVLHLSCNLLYSTLNVMFNLSHTWLP